MVKWGKENCNREKLDESEDEAKEEKESALETNSNPNGKYKI